MRTRVIIAIYFGIVLLTALSFVVLGPFLLSITLGAAFGISLLPLKERLCGWLKFSGNTCSIIICSLFAILVLTPMVFATWRIVTGIQSTTKLETSMDRFESKAATAATDVAQSVSKSFDKEMVRQKIHEFRDTAVTWIQNSAKALITGLFDLAVHFIMILLSMFLVLTGYRRLISKMRQSKFFSTQSIIQFNEILETTCRDICFSNVLTGALQSLMVAIGIAFFTEHDPYLTFVFTFIFSFVPVVGAAPVALAASLFELVDKNYDSAIWLVILACVVGVSDNIVRAIMMTHDKEDSPVINLLACIGGIYVWGLPGLFVGPLVVTLAIKVTPLLMNELRRQPTKLDAASGENKQLILVETSDLS